MKATTRVKKGSLELLRRFVSSKLATRIESTLTRRHIRRFERSIGLDRLGRKFLKENPCTVHSGPFVGMRYVHQADGSALLPKLIGSYEQELAAVLEEAIRRAPHTVLDVGCAEGYYAVGLSLRLPEAKVIGFDIDSHARASCAKLAKENGVGARVSVSGRCDHAELRRRISGPTLLICDCEGFEWDLLDLVAVPSLASVDMIVELHGKSRGEAENAIRERFGVSHVLQFIADEPRVSTGSEPLRGWSDVEQALALNEFRTDGNLWAWAKAKSRP